MAARISAASQYHSPRSRQEERTLPIDRFEVLLYFIFLQRVSMAVQCRRLGCHFFSKSSGRLDVAIVGQELSH